MEGIREVAIAYYERASEKEKDLVKEFFKRLDVNGDGKVSLPELKKNVESRLSNENIFNKLDKNGDGFLDFVEVLTVYYLVNKVSLQACSGCYELMVGPYFSCILCHEKAPDRYDLCCECHRGGKSKHEHSPDHMLDHHSLLLMLRNRGDADKSKRKKEMETLREISISHYEAGSREVQALAYEFFKSMDIDGDGCVDLQEFLSFMREQGFSQLRSPHFFKEIDRDGNGSLDFWEVMTLYYIVKSGRPFCDGCGDFISGIYFSCVECFKVPKGAFNLCHDCYRFKKWNHDHSGCTSFLDNYTLLELTKHLCVGEATGVNRNQPTTSSNSIVSLQQRSAPPPYSSDTTQSPYPRTNYPNATTHWPNYVNQHAASNMYYTNTARWPSSHTVGVPYCSNPAAWPSSDMVSVTYYTNPNPLQWPASNMVSIPNASNSVVPYTPNIANPNVRPTNNMEKVKVALRMLEIALNAGAVASLAACTIL